MKNIKTFEGFLNESQLNEARKPSQSEIAKLAKDTQGSVDPNDLEAVKTYAKEKGYDLDDQHVKFLADEIRFRSYDKKGNKVWSTQKWK